MTGFWFLHDNKLKPLRFSLFVDFVMGDLARAGALRGGLSRVHILNAA